MPQENSFFCSEIPDFCGFMATSVLASRKNAGETPTLLTVLLRIVTRWTLRGGWAYRCDGGDGQRVDCLGRRLWMEAIVKTLILSIMLVVLCCAAFAREHAEAGCSQEERTQWVASVLREAYAVKVGMTRKDLLKVYTEEGGMSNRKQRTYGLKECPYIQVDVFFAPVGNERNVLVENLNDKIIDISRPYLGYSPTD